MKNKKTRYIFITGGVLSGLGKGVFTASIGNLLKFKGYKVFIQKMDPYFNSDPGTINPYQHGEIFVTNDGTETDLDLGYYERFTDIKTTQDSNWTQGKILSQLFSEERNGKYMGKTIQITPHVTNKIKEKIILAGKNSKADFVITEIGGTIGDIESQPFILALAEFIRKNKSSSMLIHTTFVPYLHTSLEHKTKPTQHSLLELQKYGIYADMLFLRSKDKLPQNIFTKIAEKSILEKNMCISVHDFANIYEIPMYLNSINLSETILKFFKIRNKPIEFERWENFVNLLMEKKEKTINIAMVGKYVDYIDAYKSIIEALKISCTYNKVNINFDWILSDDIIKSNVGKKIKKSHDGIVILPGFGKRGFEGKVYVADYAFRKDIPTFGICYGFQAMVVAHAKRKKIQNATSSEISNKGNFVIDIIKENKNLGGTLRLGESRTIHKVDSLLYKLYDESLESYERHRHRYEVNPTYVDQIEDEEFVFSGFSSDENFVEVCEMPKLKFYLGLQAHPEFNANPLRPHPLFEGFIKSVIKSKYK